MPEQEGAEYRDDVVRGHPVRIGVKKRSIAGFSITYSAYVECPLCENPSTRKALGRKTPEIAINAVKKSLSGHMRTEHPQSLEMDSRLVAVELEVGT